MYTIDEVKEALGDDYGFHQSKTIDEVKKILETGEMPVGDNDNVPFVLEVGNLDIEITIYYGMGVISEGSIEAEPMTIGYYCCIRKNGLWESYADVPDEVNLDAPDLETEMFRVLSNFAEMQNLSFFASNEHTNQNESSRESEDEPEM